MFKVRTRNIELEHEIIDAVETVSFLRQTFQRQKKQLEKSFWNKERQEETCLNKVIVH